MKFSQPLTALAFLAAEAAAWNPSNNYGPSTVACPNNGASLLRRAHSLSDEETAWVEARHKVTDPALISFLERQSMDGLDATEFLANVSLNIGIAFSGGGYRAMLAGGGQLAALDSRTTGSTGAGHLGGLLQASTYLSGLSGGGWLVSSVALNNFSSVQDLQQSSDVWKLDEPIYSPDGIDILGDAVYYNQIAKDVRAKHNAGFKTTFTDVWGRALSQQFIGLKDGGPALEFSDIQQYSAFANHQMPMPFLVSLGRAPDTKILSTNSTVFEINPYALGSWDPTLYAFTNLKYIGTNVSNGVPLTSQCVTGFDNGGFMLGTSSSLFNQFMLQVGAFLKGLLYDVVYGILDLVDKANVDIAIYQPNPFANVPGADTIGSATYLALVDGGEDNQNVPFYPLQQPNRAVDVIFAYDNSADTDYNWPNGSSIMTTYTRQFSSQGNHTIFPSSPDTTSFVNLGLNSRPAFFGCYASNFTTLREQTGADEDDVPPVIVYTSNAPYSYYSNTSTFKLEYSTKETQAMIQNGYNTATQANGTIDAEWGACVGCAIVQREFERRGLEQTDQCKKCFDKYCWDGSLSTTLKGVYQPTKKLN